MDNLPPQEVRRGTRNLIMPIAALCGAGFLVALIVFGFMGYRGSQVDAQQSPPPRASPVAPTIGVGDNPPRKDFGEGR